MKNIFEGAKFGDKFVTNTNLPALYIRKEGNEHILIVKPGPIIFCGDDGSCYGICSPFRRTDYIALSIVSRYKEPIDEDKIYEFEKIYGLAKECADNIIETTKDNPFPKDVEDSVWFGIVDGYIEGYYKGKSE